jgi:hypothetical protein
MQVFRDKNGGVSICTKDEFKLLNRFENSIEVVSPVTLGL